MKIYVQQPALPSYRVPFFQEWSQRDGVDLKLVFSAQDSALTNEQPIGFDGSCIAVKEFKFGSKIFTWHPAQWRGAIRGACDVLVLSWDVKYLSLVPALIRARIHGIKTILWGHGYSKNESHLRKTLRDTVGRMADALVFYDYATAQEFIASGWPEARIHVAPNALNQEAIQAARSYWLERPELLSSFQQSQRLAGRKNIIYIGRIYDGNRLDVLIKAMPTIRSKQPDVQLLIIGAVNELAKELQEIAAQYHVSDCTQWLGAVYDENQIAPYMLSSQIFCYPANIGLSIIHAMGYGLPVVTGDYLPGHNPEIDVLQDGENGCLFKHLDSAALSAKIISLLDAPSRTESMGVAARDAVMTKYTISNMVDGFMSAVRQVTRTEGQ